MTDLKMRSVSEDFKEEELRQIIEMLFFAYRDFTKEPDKMLEEIGVLQDGTFASTNSLLSEKKNLQL